MCDVGRRGSGNRGCLRRVAPGQERGPTIDGPVRPREAARAWRWLTVTAGRGGVEGGTGANCADPAGAEHRRGGQPWSWDAHRPRSGRPRDGGAARSVGRRRTGNRSCHGSVAPGRNQSRPSGIRSDHRGRADPAVVISHRGVPGAEGGRGPCASPAGAERRRGGQQWFWSVRRARTGGQRGSAERGAARVGQPKLPSRRERAGTRADNRGPVVPQGPREPGGGHRSPRGVGVRRGGRGQLRRPGRGGASAGRAAVVLRCAVRERGTRGRRGA